jgi:hypothetical protein
MSFRIVMIAAAVATISAGPAIACKGVDKLLEDDFASLDFSWQELGPKMVIDNGRLTLSPEFPSHSSTSYEGDFFNDADACVTVVAPDVKDDNIGLAGMLFYLTNDYQFYAFVILPGAGAAAVMRFSNGDYLTPVGFRPAKGLKTGPNSKNTLRVTWNKGSVATYINDVPFATFKAKPPANGKIGFYAESKGGTWSFDDLLVTSAPR